MTEVWKDIEGYEGMYKVSNLGRLYSYKRYRTKGGYTYGKECNGYKEFYLCRGKDDHIRKYVHILVYEAFIGKIPKDYVVHHKNHNKKDNRVENLELLSDSEHKIKHSKEDYNNKKEKLHRKSYSISQYTIDGEFIAEYQSAKEAELKLGIEQSLIRSCCSGHKKTCYGYVFKYNKDLIAA